MSRVISLVNYNRLAGRSLRVDVQAFFLASAEITLS